MQRVSPYTAIWNKDLSKEQIHSNISKFVNKLIPEHDWCINPRNKRPNGCPCLEVFRINKDSLYQLIQKLVKYKSKKNDERQLFLHGVFTHANLRKEELCQVREKLHVMWWPIFSIWKVKPYIFAIIPCNVYSVLVQRHRKDCRMMQCCRIKGILKTMKITSTKPVHAHRGWLITCLISSKKKVKHTQHELSEWKLKLV